ncbi:hypothetical protein [Streptomyces sp. CT34]|uniref:hypothetical protein n=1 Tax=Streptomyces sp. CT34 TaxID=1553907 RepID=UPI0012FF378B|nr:hypothetical protein [Streptomyces sp. CT34]
MATAIASTAGVALAVPASATTSYGHPHQKVIVIVVKESRECRDVKVVKVVIIKKDRKVVIIKKFLRCDFRRHHDYFAKAIFFEHEFHRTHKVFKIKAPDRGTIPLAPAKVSVSTNPIRVSINVPRPSTNLTSPSSLGNLTPGHVNVSSSGVTAGSGATSLSLGTGGITAGSGSAGASLGAGGMTASR